MELFFGREPHRGALIRIFKKLTYPVLADIFPNVNNPNLPNQSIKLQQDAAPPHYAFGVREFLKTVFLEGGLVNAGRQSMGLFESLYR